MDRAYLQKEDGGQTTCCWEAPSLEALRELFDRTGTPYQEMTEVLEHQTEALVE